MAQDDDRRRGEQPSRQLVPYEVEALTLDPVTRHPVLILRPRNAQGEDVAGSDEERLPIWIGLAEAAAIQAALEGKRSKRPMTHDLMLALTEALGGELIGIVVHQLAAGTYHAKLRILNGDRLLFVDSRTSDAIALALGCDAEILIHEDVIERALAKSDSAAGESGEQEDDPASSLSDLGPEAFGDYEM